MIRRSTCAAGWTETCRVAFLRTLRPARLHRLILVGMSVMSRRTPSLAQFVLMSGRSILGMIRRSTCAAGSMETCRVAFLRTLRPAQLHRLILVGMSVMSRRMASLNDFSPMTGSKNMSNIRQSIHGAGMTSGGCRPRALHRHSIRAIGAKRSVVTPSPRPRMTPHPMTRHPMPRHPGSMSIRSMLNPRRALASEADCEIRSGGQSQRQIQREIRPMTFVHPRARMHSNQVEMV